MPDLSLGGPFGDLDDFELGLPYEPPGGKLFKFTKREWADSIVQGKIWLSPITAYHDTVHHRGSVGDETEGRARLQTSEGDQVRENPAFRNFTAIGEGFMFGPNAVFRGNCFCDDGFANAYIWCASSSRLPATTVRQMDVSYDALVVIEKWMSFFTAIGRAMKPHAYKAIIGACEYSGRGDQILWQHPQIESWRKVFPRALQKLPKFSDQDEVRMVFFTEKRPQKGFELDVPEAARFVSGVQSI